MSDNRWVADCPCGGGIGCWPEHAKGCCYDCCTVHPIRFPAPQALSDAVTVLEARPEPAARNWRPDQGEDVTSLKAENLVRALPLKRRG